MSIKDLAQWMARRPIRRRKVKTLAERRGPSSLGELLAALSGDEMMSGGSPISRQMWLELVGPRIADRSTPARLDASGTLIVLVPDSVWSQELSLLSSTIVARLAALGFHVQGLRFVVAKVTPPRRAPTRFERRKVAAPAELPADLQEQMETIEDPLLRETLERAAACSLADNEESHRGRSKRRRR